MKRLILAAGTATMLLLAGCASGDYDKYLAMQEKISNNYKAASNVNAIALANIAKNSESDVVQAVAAMALMNTAGKAAQGPMLAPPRNEALEWFRAATPLLGSWINGRFSLKMQESNNAAEVEMYSTQMGAFRDIAVEGIRKEPLPVVVVPPASTVHNTPADPVETPEVTE